MGNTDSIPVVSQVKSLVLVIGGQAEEAKEVQENFARTGIIASQINSLRYSIEVGFMNHFNYTFKVNLFMPSRETMKRH